MPFRQSTPRSDQRRPLGTFLRIRQHERYSHTRAISREIL